MENKPLLEEMFLGNMLSEWLIAIAVFAIALFALKFFKTVIIVKLKVFAEKTKSDADDLIIGGVNAIHWPFYVCSAFYIALNFIVLPAYFERWAFYIFLIAVIFYAIKFFEKLIDYGTEAFVKRKGEDGAGSGIVKLASISLKIGLWIGAVVLILSNMGYNVTSLIAGLGIGGIAIALALQNILGDLFSSLAIYLDKPFKIGDTIVLGDNIGTVEKIGIKTTRIKLLQGEELVVSNQELSTSQVRNFGTMENRRVVMTIGVTYDTPAEKLKKIPVILREIIGKHEDVDIDRSHFKALGDSSLIFEVVFFVNSPGYSDYMDIQEKFNLGIVERFEKEKIDFAYPTQTVYVKK